MSILDHIIAEKKKEVIQQKELVPVDLMEKSAYIDRKAVSLSSVLHEDGSSGIIAEFKRKSPSGGRINESADPVSVATAYTQAGAAGLSVLTDRTYFGGTAADLSRVRLACMLPVLRKEFIIDEYQVLESKAIGADVILLIASVLGKKEIRRLSGMAKSIGLEVLLEIHCERELDSIHETVDLVGVNNRDLKKMVTDIETSRRLAQKIPGEFAKVSESGISKAETIMELRDHGFKGFLIGEFFMREVDPGEACRNLINNIIL
jgi:indole-3-glycerol phosphate synthase